MTRDGQNKSLWQQSLQEQVDNKQVSLPVDIVFDVVIVGGGITGISTGLELQNAGKKVLIAEAYNIGFGTTGGTTAHLNSFLDTSYADIRKKFSVPDAKSVANAIAESLALIQTNITKYGIDCDYKQLPAYLFSRNQQQSKDLDEILIASREAGIEAAYANDLPVNMEYEKIVSFANQAQFHPLRYLHGLASAFINAGGIIAENCRITGVDEHKLLTITSTRGTLSARYLIYATHIPPGINLLHFRCAPYRSYALSIQLSNENDYPDALIYDMEDPYHYFRTQEIDGEKFLIAGGEDHKTGHEKNTDACFLRLESFVRKYFDVKRITHKWSSQYFEPTDGLAYIGQLPGSGDKVLVATGYGGNGMVYSGIAAIVLSHIINTGNSKYQELFDPHRIKMVAGFKNFVAEAADVIQQLASSILPPATLPELADLAPGEAKVITYEKTRLAIYKDEQSRFHAVNPACTHIKCEVAWNNTECSWDCPCHGSRFDIDGRVLTAPARKDLEIIQINTLK